MYRPQHSTLCRTHWGLEFGRKEEMPRRSTILGGNQEAVFNTETGQEGISQTKVPGRPGDIWEREFLQGQSLRLRNVQGWGHSS